MQEKTRKEEEYYDKLREEGSKAKKNQSNVAYDILTLQYNQDEVGLQQKYMDDMGMFDRYFLQRIYFFLFTLLYHFSAIPCSCEIKSIGH